MVNNYVNNVFYMFRVRLHVNKCKKLHIQGYTGAGGADDDDDDNSWLLSSLIHQIGSTPNLQVDNGINIESQFLKDMLVDNPEEKSVRDGKKEKM